MRKIFFWMHLSAGVLAGIVIFIMSVTGVLLMYEKQMISWFDLRNLPPMQGANRLPVDTLLAQARASRGTLPAAIALYADPARPVQLTFGRDAAYQDPSTGQLLSTGNSSVRQFFRVVTDWHRWLAMSDESRATGRSITGASNLLFLFIVLSGAYLWLPRVWTAASVRAIAWFKGGLSGKARDFNWHNAIGIWCFVPLAFVVASATVISYPWASNLVYTLSGTPPPPAPAQKKEGAPGARARKEGGEGETRKQRKGEGSQRPEGGSDSQPAAAGVQLAGLDELWRRAASHANNWRVMTLRVPESDRAPLVFTIDQGYAGQPQKRTTLTLDRSGAVRSSETYDDLNLGRRIRTWMRFVHTGEYYGLTGQTIAGIASLGGAFLTYTGIALSIRRLFAWRSRRARVRERQDSTELVP